MSKSDTQNNRPGSDPRTPYPKESRIRRTHTRPHNLSEPERRTHTRPPRPPHLFGPLNSEDSGSSEPQGAGESEPELAPPLPDDPPSDEL